MGTKKRKSQKQLTELKFGGLCQLHTRILPISKTLKFVTSNIGSKLYKVIIIKCTLQQQEKKLCGDFPGGQMVKNPPSRMGRRDSLGVQDGQVHTAIFEMDNKQGPTLSVMELYSMLCSSLDARGIWGRMDACVHMADIHSSLFT